MLFCSFALLVFFSEKLAQCRSQRLHPILTYQVELGYKVELALNRVRAEMQTLFETNGKKSDSARDFYFLSPEHQSNRWRILQSGEVVEIFLNFFSIPGETRPWKRGGSLQGVVTCCFTSVSLSSLAGSINPYRGVDRNPRDISVYTTSFPILHFLFSLFSLLAYSRQNYKE